MKTRLLELYTARWHQAIHDGRNYGDILSMPESVSLRMEELFWQHLVFHLENEIAQERIAENAATRRHLSRQPDQWRATPRMFKHIFSA